MFLGAYGMQIVFSKIYLPWLLSLLGNLTPYSPREQGCREEKQNRLLNKFQELKLEFSLSPESVFNHTRVFLRKLEHLMVGGQMPQNKVYLHQDQGSQGDLEDPILKMKGTSTC